MKMHELTDYYFNELTSGRKTRSDMQHELTLQRLTDKEQSTIMELVESRLHNENKGTAQQTDQRYLNMIAHYSHKIQREGFQYPDLERELRDLSYDDEQIHAIKRDVENHNKDIRTNSRSGSGLRVGGVVINPAGLLSLFKRK